MNTNYISEDYCTDEIRSLLEEHGYVGATNTYLNKDGFRVKEITLQSAMKWLREAHDVFISVEPGTIFGMFDVYVYYDNYTKLRIIERNKDNYEEACEAAIKYCLGNMI